MNAVQEIKQRHDMGILLRVSHLPPVQTAVECVSNSPW